MSIYFQMTKTSKFEDALRKNFLTLFESIVDKTLWNHFAE